MRLGSMLAMVSVATCLAVPMACAETLEQLREAVREATDCYFDESMDAPKVIRLHFVRDEVFARGGQCLLQQERHDHPHVEPHEAADALLHVEWQGTEASRW